MSSGRAAAAFAAGVLCIAGSDVACSQSGPYWVPARNAASAAGSAPDVQPAAKSPLPAPKSEPGWPRVVQDPKTSGAPAVAPSGWSAQDVEVARARCNVLLKGIDAVVLPVEPIKDGDCGTAAPVQLVSIGKSPQVALSPPAVVTCEMVAGLDKWLKGDLQPLARKHLGSPIIKMEIMSSYSCRNAYGRTKTRLSEHGRANALDIRGFMTANAQPVELLADWGPTQREIAAQVAAAKAAAAKAEAERAAAAASGKAGAATAQQQAPAAATQTGAIPDSMGTIIDGLPRVRVTVPGSAPSQGNGATGLGLAAPNRLGGPKSPSKAGKGAPAEAQALHLPQEAQHAQDRKSQFLRAAHASGCRIFGTILGPEANNAHRNHLHVDMAERATSNFCE